MQQQQLQETEFNIIDWLLLDVPPCEGGKNVQVCIEDCWNEGCPYFQQSQAA